MASTKSEWPKWTDSAAKGDVVAGLVATRSCIVNIYVCLRALERGDMAKFSESLDALDQADVFLQRQIDRIGGSDGK